MIFLGVCSLDLKRFCFQNYYFTGNLFSKHFLIQLCEMNMELSVNLDMSTSPYDPFPPTIKENLAIGKTDAKFNTANDQNSQCQNNEMYQKPVGFVI